MARPAILRRLPDLLGSAGRQNSVSRSEQSRARLVRWQDYTVSPTVLRRGPYRLLFFSSDRGEPVHVHVIRDRKAAKFWLNSVRLEYNLGFAPSELSKVEALVRQLETELIEAWHDYFRSGR